MHVACLSGELGNGECAERMRSAGDQRRKPGYKEVQTGERHHVHRQFTQISIQLAREAEASCDSGHGYLKETHPLERHQCSDFFSGFSKLFLLNNPICFCNGEIYSQKLGGSNRCKSGCLT